MRGVKRKMQSQKAKKWRQYKFKDKTRGMMRLTYLQTYCVDSVIRGISYAADDKEFAIIRGEGFIVCEIDEIPLLAKDLIPTIREEVLEIYNDLQDLKLMEVIYA